MLHQTCLAACQQCQEDRKPQYQATAASTEDLIESTSMCNLYHKKGKESIEFLSSDLYQNTEEKSKTILQSLLLRLKQARHSETSVRYFMVLDTFLWSGHTDFNLMYMIWKYKRCKSPGHDPLTTWPHSHALRAHNQCDIFTLQKDPPNLFTVLWLGVDFFRIV